ncbi:glycoprotein hormone alpha-2 isoform X2 [Canis lupus baileyi]|nr:glycoprotein hormone alpha-2 isoform X2 [Canis lupus dingo]
MSNELLGLNQNKMTDLLHKSLSRILPHLSKGFIYSFMRDREKGAETESEGEAGSSQGAQRGTRFQIPRPRPEPKANAQPLSHPGISVKSYHLGAMSLKPFTYPFPETRFLHAGPNVYKFKIRYGNNIRGEEIEDKEVIVQELEDSIRVVLGNLDSLQPFATEHFIIFPYKSKWESISHLKFKHGEIVLVPYPFVFTLYVEMKWFHESLSAGKPIKDSPLGLVLTERKAAGAMMRKRKQVEVLSSPSRPGLDRAKIGISSQSPSKKKPLMETRRIPMASPQTLFLCLLVLAVTEGWGRQAAIPGCHLHPFNVTVRSDRQGTCQGSHVAQACVGHCESSAFPSRYSVLVASGYRHNMTSVSQCCTISGLKKVKVQLQCGGDQKEELEIFTARACQCDMCRLSRY